MWTEPEHPPNVMTNCFQRAAKRPEECFLLFLCLLLLVSSSTFCCFAYAISDVSKNLAYVSSEPLCKSNSLMYGFNLLDWRLQPGLHFGLGDNWSYLSMWIVLQPKPMIGLCSDRSWISIGPMSKMSASMDCVVYWRQVLARFEARKLKMPLIVKDYVWEETDKNVFITVPLKGVKANKVDILSSEEYLKVSCFQVAVLIRPRSRF